MKLLKFENYKIAQMLMNIAFRYVHLKNFIYNQNIN